MFESVFTIGSGVILSPIVPVAVAVQRFASVTVTLYAVPDGKPVKAEALPPDGSFHRYEYGVVPLLTCAISCPFDAVQMASTVETETIGNGAIVTVPLADTGLQLE